MKINSIEQARYVCDESLFWFIKIIGGPKSGRDSSKEIHKPLCDFWQDPANKRIGIGMPRDWLKSTDFTCWDTIREYLLDIESRQLIAMEKEKLGKAKLKFIKEQLLNNELLRKIYYDKLYWLDKNWTKNKKWSETEIDLPHNEIYAESTMSVIGIKGAAQSGHYEIIRIDDIIGEDALNSILVMEKAFAWFDNTFELLSEPDYQSPMASKIKVIGSPWGPGDVYWYIKKNYPEFEWRITPALKDTKLKDEENIKWVQNPNVEHNESNFPKLFNTRIYLEMQANPEKQQIFWAQHQCNPQRATGLRKFERDWLHFYRVEDRDGHIFLICDKCDIDVPLSKIPLYGMVDVAGFGETKSIKAGARNALLIGGQPREMIQKFVTYAWAKRLRKPSVFRQKLYEAHKNHKPRSWRIDTTGVGNAIYADIMEEKRKECPQLRISPLPSDVKKDIKDSDIQALINPAANGEIHVHQSMKEFLAEYEQYPGGLTLDLLDMLAKLNRYYWSRKPRLEGKFSRTLDYMSGRSSVGGY